MLGWVLWRIFTCSPGYLNRQAVARSNVAQTFVRSFPESRQNIAYGTGIFGQPTWQGRALVAGRYIFTIAIPLHANRVSGRIYAVGTPIVTLHEVVGISRLGDGRLVFTYGGTWYIRQEEWEGSLQRGNDVQLFDPDAKTKGPVPGLQQAWERG